jgi:XTP/dITP diphosphohydrolase
MAERIVLLVTSPRLPAGLLTAEAWDLVRAAPVYVAADSPQTAALRTSAVAVKVIGGEPATAADALLADPASTVVWLAGPDGDPDIARHLGMRLAREPGTAEMELVYGSWDPPGARLLDVVAVMDKLRSPGGCPWDAEQTHQSLAHYLLEEAYEAYDEMVRGDLAALREELGDVLLQVAFHSRLAEELPEAERWSIDEVAGDLVDKLVRRHPHVFGDVAVEGAAHVEANWQEIKRAEKSRESSMDGVALSQPALALATKLLSRAARAGVVAPVPDEPTDPTRDEAALGAALIRLVAAAVEAGLDAEGALRQTALNYADAVRERETPSGS